MPAEVAGAVGQSWQVLALWGVGGLAALAGALSYAELASRFPSIGGEYHFLRLAWGARVSALFMWARVAVMQTGAIATVGFVAGDYAASLWPDGPSPALWAGMAVIVVTLANMASLEIGRQGQRWLVGAVLAAILMVIIAAPFVAAGSVPQSNPAPGSTGIGLALVFVMLAYGGWNEAAYLSAEVKGGPSGMVRALVGGLLLVILLYLALNAALLWGLGRDGLAATPAPATALMNAAFGPLAAALLGAAVVAASLSTMNATVITGARAMCAIGRDIPALAFIGKWDNARSVPRTALAVQAVVALALTAYGATARDGFTAMVAFGAPAFWLFLALTALSLFRLRATHPGASGFTVPLYPVIPLLFLGACLVMLWSAVDYARFLLGASEGGRLAGTLGIGLLLAGLPLVWKAR